MTHIRVTRHEEGDTGVGGMTITLKVLQWTKRASRDVTMSCRDAIENHSLRSQLRISMNPLRFPHAGLGSQVLLLCWLVRSSLLHAVPGPGVAQLVVQLVSHRPEERGAEDDEDPGIHDGVHREEPQRQQVLGFIVIAYLGGSNVCAHLSKKERNTVSECQTHSALSAQAVLCRDAFCSLAGHFLINIIPERLLTY